MIFHNLHSSHTELPVHDDGHVCLKWKHSQSCQKHNLRLSEVKENLAGILHITLIMWCIIPREIKIK